MQAGKTVYDRAPTNYDRDTRTANGLARNRVLTAKCFVNLDAAFCATRTVRLHRADAHTIANAGENARGMV